MATEYNILHSIPIIIGTSARCQTCAQILSDDRNLHEGFCAAHNAQASSYEAILGRACCILRDNFELHRQRTWIARWNTLPSLGLGGLMTAPENNLWLRAEMLTGECENSLIELHHYMTILLQSMDWITSIEEMKYWTGDYFGFTHCAFKITLTNNQVFVFDPTGIQFGPEWAVLTPWEDYVLERGARESWGLPSLVVRPLGRNEDWVLRQNRQGTY